MTRAFVWIVVAYLAAAVVALVVGSTVPFAHPIAVALAADVTATLVVFAFSYRFANSSIYDPYWSVAPLPIALYWAARPESADPDRLRQVVVTLLVAAWGARLTANWARGWRGLHDEDWRYRLLQEQHGRRYWWVSFAGIHMMPTLWVFLGCLPLYAVMSAATRDFGVVDALATLVTGGAIWLEHQADEELRRFRRTPHDAQAIFAEGLWARCRHPNYLGEMGFWWGLWLFGLAANPAWWWTIVGAASISAMFRWISIPMIEERMRQRRPTYAEHMKKVPMVLPRLRPQAAGRREQ